MKTLSIPKGHPPENYCHPDRLRDRCSRLPDRLPENRRHQTAEVQKCNLELPVRNPDTRRKMGRRVRARLSLVLTPHPLGPLSNRRILATLMKTFNDRKVIRSCDLIFQKNNLKLVSNNFVRGKIGCILSSPHVICKTVFKTDKLRCVNKQNTSESLLFDSFSIFIILFSEGHK